MYTTNMSHIYYLAIRTFTTMDKDKQQSLQIAFGKNVKRIRQEKDLTQMQLAVKAETDIRQIQRIEAGEIATSIAQAQMIAEALEVGLEELVK